MARSTMRLEELREKAENAAFYVSISYRVVYVLVAIALFWSKSFWPITIAFLLTAVGLEIFEYVTSIITWYLCYLSLRRAGKKDSDEIERPSFANKLYWICWVLKVFATIGIIVSIGYELFSLIQPSQ